MSSPQPTYELLYHPAIPGRGEFIRLAFEATGTPYTDIANADPSSGYKVVQQTCMDPSALFSAGPNPLVFAPPALRVQGAGKNGEALIIGQTPNVLLYLGEKFGLVPEGEEDGEGGKYFVHQLALTALDLNNEVHDTHHPVAPMKYYEEQKDEAVKKARDVRENRLPKYFSYFERVLKGNGNGKFMVGDKLTYGDLVVWQVLDGLGFAFPKEMEGRREEFEVLFEWYEGLKGEVEGLKKYLESGRRLKYGDGVFRHYPELDRQ